MIVETAGEIDDPAAIELSISEIIADLLVLRARFQKIENEKILGFDPMLIGMIAGLGALLIGFVLMFGLYISSQIKLKRATKS